MTALVPHSSSSTGSSLTLTQNASTALTLSGASGGITFGGDTNLYRINVGTLATDGSFQAGTFIRSWPAASANTVVLGTANGGTPGAGITFGSASDTNLYRFSAGQLQTDGSLLAGGRIAITGNGFQFQNRNIDVAGRAAFVMALNNETNDRFQVYGDGTIKWGPGGASTPDTNLYRFFGNGLKTDGSLVVGSALSAVPDGTDGRVYIGNSTAPAANSTGGGILYVSAGALKYRGSSGTITPLAPA